MAKDKSAAATRDVVVRLHSMHIQSPDQYEVLVSGVRVGYVCHGESMPICWLHPDTIRGLKLTPTEKIEILTEARKQLAPLMAERDAETQRIAELLAGEAGV